MSFDWKNPDYPKVYAERIERLRRLLVLKKVQPEALDQIKAYYKDNPVAFINDWGMTMDPRNADLGRPVDIPFLLFPKQEEGVRWVVDMWRKRETAILEKSRDMGASWMVVWVAIWMWTFYPGSAIGFGSRKEEYVDSAGDPKALFPKIRFGIEHLPREFRPAKWDIKSCAPFMRIMNPDNGSIIFGEAGDNIGRGARASIYFVDEAAFLERPHLIEASLSQTTNCRIDLSTPNGESNPFAAKKFAGVLPCFTMHWRDHPAKDEAWYRAQKRKLDDPVIIAQELDIDYAASASDQLIKSTLTSAAIEVDSSTLTPEGPLKMGVDVARFGNNKSTIALRKGRVAYWVKEESRYDTEQVADWVVEECTALPKMPDQIAVDVIGIGAGVFDKLKRKWPDRVVAVNSAEKVEGGKFYNRRAFMWSELREWLKDEPVSLPNDRKLTTQICAPKYSYRNDLLLIESKEDMVKRGVQSPDKADALAMTFAKPAHEIEQEKPRRPAGNWRTA